jgi:CPA2 family monovalent cation:H+ antiporter-2
MHELPLLTTIAAGFACAWILGIIAHRIGLSPIVGYLAAGVVIGPYTPGYIGDKDLAHQLAEIGVILMMFGVGLHFKLRDLYAVRSIAIPGAIGQSLFATLAAMVLFHWLGMSWTAGAVLGMSMAVASTVVLLRVLMDRRLLTTPAGHAAVGWLIVEDIFTVLALVFVPMLATFVATQPDQPLQNLVGAAPGLADSARALADSAAALAPDANLAESAGALATSAQELSDTAHAVAKSARDVADAAHPAEKPSPLFTILWAVAKLGALVVVVLLAGSRVVPWILARVAKLRSRELFTLTVLVMSIAIAVGSAAVFGASVALGAFLAGMVVAQSPASHQAAADALPLRDAFGVLFFVAIGMLFDPTFVMREPLLLSAALVVVLIVKPLTALIIVAVLGYPLRTGLTVALGLAQIGEFSFILGQVAFKNNLLGDNAIHTLVAAAIVSITINPLLVGSMDTLEAAIRRRPRLHGVLAGRAERRRKRVNAANAANAEMTAAPAAEASAPATVPAAPADQPVAPARAIIVGYGPVGRVVDALLRDAGVLTTVIDLNLKAIEGLAKANHAAIYGDATRPEILHEAGIEHATYLVVTLPQSDQSKDLVAHALEHNPNIRIILRARYLAERDALVAAGASRIAFEEGETGIAMAREVLMLRGVDDATMKRLLRAIRTLWKMDA